MKKIYFLLILFPQFIFAQNFSNIITPGCTYYQDSIHSFGYLEGIKSDSIFPQGNGDTIFLENNTIRNNPSQTYIDTVGGILGRKIYKKHDGWYYFFNLNNDTLFLKSPAILNESWKFCKLTANGYLMATCTGSLLFFLSIRIHYI